MCCLSVVLLAWVYHKRGITWEGASVTLVIAMFADVLIAGLIFGDMT